LSIKARIASIGKSRAEEQEQEKLAFFSGTEGISQTYCGAMMGGASLPGRAAIAFRNAGATEEMVARARLIYGSLPSEPPGRPRKYKNAKEADHAFYMRHRDRFRQKREISLKKQASNGEALHALTVEEVKAIHATADPLGGSGICRGGRRRHRGNDR
jgi:hypothetical protein